MNFIVFLVVILILFSLTFDLFSPTVVEGRASNSHEMGRGVFFLREVEATSSQAGERGRRRRRPIRTCED